MTETRNDSISKTDEAVLVAWAAFALGLVSLAYCFRHELLLLYGDAVAHLYIARRTLASRNPGFRQLGSVWLPLPHILLLPFVAVSSWWRNGLAGAFVSIPSYALGCAGIYRLARAWFPVSAALLALAFYALNPGLLYMATTAMTEPLFLAEMIWATLLVVLWMRSLDVDQDEAFSEGQRKASARSIPRRRSSSRLLIWLGIVLVAAIFTRYDGWILAAAVWAFVTLRLGLRQQFRATGLSAWIVFTALVVAAPAIWLGYNAMLFGDPLDFLRGPYSAQAIEARTSASELPMHPGYHSMRVSALYFLKAAEMGAVPVRFGNWLLWLALAGTVAALYRFRHRQFWPALLLWLPLPFYAYSVAYGSVPIFIPVWWPFSWYNTRYGMELLPAFALFIAAAVATLQVLIPRFHRWVIAVVFLLLVWNAVVLLRARPLVFQEAMANSRTRIPFEESLARALLRLPSEGLILMYTSQHPGAFQRAGISLHRVVSEEDYLEWKHALEAPAQAAPTVIAVDGDPVAKAVQQHPQDLDLQEVICSMRQPCARVYRSRVYTPRLPGPANGTGG